MDLKSFRISRPGPKALTAIVIAVIVVAVLFLLRTPPKEIEIGEVTRGAMTVAIEDEGETRVRDMFVVAAPITGRMLRNPLEPGDPVIAGQTVVARLAPANSDFLDPASERQLQAQIKALQANIATMRARVTQSAADKRLTSAQHDRVAELHNRGFATDAALDEARAARDRSAADLVAANRAMEAAQFELTAARARLSGPGARPGARDVHSVLAPESGSVLRLVQESEATVSVGSPLIEIGNPGQMEVVTDLLSTDAVQIKPGDPVSMERWGGEPLRGKVRIVEPYGFLKISALGVEEQRVNVIIDFTDPKEKWSQLGHGYRVIVRVLIWSGEDVLQVPISALFRDQGQWSVFTVEGGDARLVPVKIGRMNDEHAQILEGLDEGDTVILHPSEKIADGISVRERSE